MNGFYIVASPSAWLGSGNSMLRGPVDSLSGLADVVQHPRHANLRSFSFAYHAHRCITREPKMLAWFDSPSKDNLLYFASPPTANVIVFNSRSVPVWYRRLSESDHALASMLGLLSENLYCQVDSQPADSFCEVTLEVDGQADFDCWMNPAILRMNLVDNQLSHEHVSGLADRLTPSRILGLEAVMNARLRSRVESALWLQRYLAKLRDEPTVVDGLFWGPRAQTTGQFGKPFTILDQLEGTFCIHSPGEHPATFSWSPPADASANLIWFARYWQQRWGGDWLDSAEPLRQVPSDPIVEQSADLDECHISQQDTRPLLESLYKKIAHGKSDRHPHAVISQFVRRGFDLGDDLGRWVLGNERAHSGSRIYVDALALTDHIAQHRLLPASPIRFCFSKQACFSGGHLQDMLVAEAGYKQVANDWYVDPIRSFHHGGWEFLSRLASCSLPSPGSTRIDWKHGWWNHTYESLFKAHLKSRASVRVALRGFRFQHSRLGRDGLIDPRPIYGQPCEQR